MALVSIRILCGCSAISEETLTEISPPELKRVSYISEVDSLERDYFLYLPKGYKSYPDSSWPIVMHLHGNGERGNGKSDLKWTLKHGPLMEAWVQKRDFPFILIVPQLHMFGRDTVLSYIANRDSTTITKRLKEGVPERLTISRPTHKMNGQTTVKKLPYGKKGNIYGWYMVENDLLQILSHTQEQYNGDKKRTYLTGLSYGGYATWYLGSKHTDKFAALAPVVGWGHPEIMPNLAKANTPIWCFAAGRDLSVPVKYFYPGLNKLEELGHTSFRFTIEADLGHDAWKRIYAGEELYNWLLAQKLP